MGNPGSSERYFGAHADEPPAPEGANPFAAPSTTETDDVAKMIAEAKAQCEAQRIAREAQEAIERERARRAFEDAGRAYVARKKPGEVDGGESHAGESRERRRTPVKAKRPGGGGGTLDAGEDEDAGSKAKSNAFAGVWANPESALYKVTRGDKMMVGLISFSFVSS